jgi:hypothetical protein
MATTSDQPSFSPRRKWGILLNVVFLSVLVLAVMVMLNGVAGRWYRRIHLSTNTRIELSPQTIGLLKSITNKVKVTLYFDEEEPLYSDIAELLREYRLHNPGITISAVDYYRNPAAAQETRLQYPKQFSATTNKNFVIFDSGGNVKMVDGKMLADYQLERVTPVDPQAKEPEFRRKPVAFNGEMHFTAALLAVTSVKPLRAYFLTGHREGSPGDPEQPDGYGKFTEVLKRNYIEPHVLSLVGTNPVPSDCNLLIIIRPFDPLRPSELQKIEDYLDQGGRLLALFSCQSVGRDLGLEGILAKWGVSVSHSIIVDPNFSYSETKADIIVSRYATNSPVMRPLAGASLEIVLPRSINRIDPPQGATDVPQVTELAFTSSEAVATNSSLPPPYSLMVTVEKNRPKGVVADRGATRMLIAGDALFLDNQMIETAVNRDFADVAINWLLDRKDLVMVGPRPVEEFRLLMDRKQLQGAEWVLLAGMPGGILLLGGLVWLRRRK